MCRKRTKGRATVRAKALSRPSQVRPPSGGSLPEPSPRFPPSSGAGSDPDRGAPGSPRFC